jgi:hypothetical protein
MPRLVVPRSLDSLQVIDDKSGLCDSLPILGMKADIKAEGGSSSNAWHAMIPKPFFDESFET